VARWLQRTCLTSLLVSAVLVPIAAEPGRVGAPLDWKQVSVASGTFTCAITTEHRLFCWGDAIGFNDDPPLPAQVGNATNWASVAAGQNHVCARKTNGRLFCWGLDDNGQLGDGPTEQSQSAPSQVAGNKKNWSTVSARGTHSCARRTNRKLFCWGRDSNGELGNGLPLQDAPAPVKVANP
jgi:alpha-tubulin suppressor-like RCC1 family protein